MANYVPINLRDMEKLLCDEMGFEPNLNVTRGEWVFDRDVTTKTGVEYPYVIRVYSSIDIRTGWSRESAKDAIRVVLLDRYTGRPVKKSEKRVHRTKNALTNLRERCRGAFRYVLEAPHCPKCNGLMVERENRKSGNRFLSCSRYAPGQPHHCDATQSLPG